MRIAFFNWRDIKNPLAGGAEVYVHQVMKRLAEQGHKVALFTSSFPGSTSHESIDGVEHIRYGGKFLIYPKSIMCYRKYIRGQYDAIVESINGPPFFTNLFAKEKVVPFIHQLTRENWYSGLPFPLAFAGYHLEDGMLSIYREKPAIVPSNSTKSDLLKLGFKDVTVIHGAADIMPAKTSKSSRKTLIYLGRLTRSKRVDHVLRAFKIILNSEPDSSLLIAGSGPAEKSLVSLARQLGISSQTEFLGRVSHKEKAEVLSKAHLMLFPAVREGWGLVTLEANACGTPVIGYNVHGLRDSIKDGINGYLVDDGDINAMAACAVKLLGDGSAMKKLSASSAEYSKTFSWDKSSHEFAALLEKVIG